MILTEAGASGRAAGSERNRTRSLCRMLEPVSWSRDYHAVCVHRTHHLLGDVVHFSRTENRRTRTPSDNGRIPADQVFALAMEAGGSLLVGREFSYPRRKPGYGWGRLAALQQDATWNIAVSRQTIREPGILPGP